MDSSGNKVMSDYPPIKIGTRVMTLMRRTGKGDYTAEAIAMRLKHDGETGNVCEYHDSHGRCYGVRFENNETAFYDPDELIS